MIENKFIILNKIYLIRLIDLLVKFKF